MRDLHLRHTLTTLARDASAVFDEIAESGQEIPYEIAESGESSAFCQYRPLTARFVRDNAAELRELESFREATETMRRSDLAATYLSEAAINPPADAVEQATLAVTYFLARLWDGCSDFEIDDDRFSAALEEIEQCAEPEAGEVEAIVPLVGFAAPCTRIDLNGASIVRADTVDAPPEAAAGDRPAGAGWEPTFLISARIALDEDGGLSGAGDRVARTFERLVTTLRLFKAGGVGLGPYGWVRVAGDRWRRISTGAGRPRAGGYRLAEEEIPDLVDLARVVSVHPKRMGRLRRALLRFESGLDRRGAVDALNDHLLALRFLLEGEGPAGVGLPMRAAALAGDADQRTEIKRTIEQATALERELWSGEPAGSAEASPPQIAMQVESLLRTIIRRGVSGELGSDLRAAADEMLLADGLAVGEGSSTQGETSEWETQPEVEAEHEAHVAEELEPETSGHDVAAAFQRFEADPAPEIVASRPTGPEAPRSIEADATPTSEPRTRSTDEERPMSQPLQQEFNQIEAGLGRAEEAPEPEAAEPEAQAQAQTQTSEEPATTEEPASWLEEVDQRPEEAMEFPKASRARDDNHIDELSKPPMEREEVRARVEYLFPRTETNWTVGQGRRQAKAG